MPVSFTLAGWDKANNYRAYGTQIENADSSIVLFSTNEAEIYIPDNTADETAEKTDDENDKTSGTLNRIRAFPSSWANGFGIDYYTQQYMFESAIQQNDSPDFAPSAPVIYNPNPDLHIPDPDTVASQIDDVMHEIVTEEA